MMAEGKGWMRMRDVERREEKGRADQGETDREDEREFK